MFQDVEIKIKKKNQVLFSRDSKCLQNLIALLCKQTHIGIILWVFDCLSNPLEKLKAKYPHESAYQNVYDTALAWAHGEVKMPIAKRQFYNAMPVQKKWMINMILHYVMH